MSEDDISVERLDLLDPSPHSSDPDAQQEAPRSTQTKVQKWLKEKEADLVRRVLDWKGHTLKDFGKLMMVDTIPIFTSHQPDFRLFRVYLFEKMLLCAKEKKYCFEELDGRGCAVWIEDSPHHETATECESMDSVLLLQGRIFGDTITDVVGFTTNETYVVEIFWRDEKRNINYFSMHFESEEEMSNWTIAMTHLKDNNTPRRTSVPEKRRTV
ncbi:Pleckstrin homology domain-containing protein [Mariannaea sp. PMI_226]|nr:Pleckstrin homology domain-containing protein [Mariannaea sp. PMI_226]